MNQSKLDMGKHKTSIISVDTDEIRLEPLHDTSKSREIFRNEIGDKKYEPLVDSELYIKNLIFEAQSGSLSARDEIICKYIRYVYLVARHFDNFGKHHLLQYSDFVNEGLHGLIKAIEKADYTRKEKFLTYATDYIAGHMYISILDNNVGLHIPASWTDRFHYCDYLEDIRNTQDGSNEEFLYQTYTRSFISEDYRSDADHILYFEDMYHAIGNALNTLTPRESDIIRLHFGIECREHTLDEIGELFDLTKERVRQLREQAIRRLRHTSRSYMLRPYCNATVPETISSIFAERKSRREKQSNLRKARLNLMKKIHINDGFRIKIDGVKYKILVTELNTRKEQIIVDIFNYEYSDSLTFELHEFLDLRRTGIIS